MLIPFVIFWVLAIFIVLCLPFVLVWAINALFGTVIVVTLTNYFAAMALILLANLRR